MRLAAIDIETKGLPEESLTDDQQAYFLKTSDKKKKLGLHPHTAEITCIGVYTPDFQHVFRGKTRITDFYNWLHTAEKDGYEFVLQRGIFDIRCLVLQEPNDTLLSCNWYDTRTMAHVCSTKVPDSYIASYNKRRELLNKELPQGVEHRAGSKYSLKVTAPYFLKVPAFWEDPSDHDNDSYVLKDCKYTYDLFKYFEEKLQSNNEWDFYIKRAVHWDRMLAKMTCRGVLLNYEKMDELSAVYAERQQAAKKKLDVIWEDHHTELYQNSVAKLKDHYNEKCLSYIENRIKNPEKIPGVKERYRTRYLEAVQKVPTKINYNSDKQMLWLLRDKLGYECVDVNGKEGTGKEILEVLAASGKDDVRTFLEFRKANKVLTSYFPAYKALSMGGTLHPYFNSGGARTGRLSSSDPNLQQVPSDLYQVFKPRPGYSFIGYDMSAIEARIIAAMSGDPVLLDIISNGHSIHDYNTKYVFFDDVDCDVTDVKATCNDKRDASKKVGFTIFYGGGYRRVKAGKILTGFPCSDASAKKELKRFKDYYKVAASYHREITKCFEDGDVIPNLLGRPVVIENPEDAYMKGFNTLVQGTASDFCLQACYNATKTYEYKGIDAHPVALVHDFIMVECVDDALEQGNQILVDAMTKFVIDCGDIKVKFEVEGFVGKVWKK